MKIICLCGPLRGGQVFILEMLRYELHFHTPQWLSNRRSNCDFISTVPESDINTINKQEIVEDTDLFGTYYLAQNELYENQLNIVVCSLRCAVELKNKHNALIIFINPIRSYYKQVNKKIKQYNKTYAFDKIYYEKIDMRLNLTNPTNNTVSELKTIAKDFLRQKDV